MARGHIRLRSPKHPDRWTIYIYVGRHPATGRSRYRTEVFRGTRKGAERRLTEILRELDTVGHVGLSGMSTADFLRRWLRDYAEVRVREKSYGIYSNFVERHIIPVLGHIPVDRLSPLDIQSMESGCLRSGLNPRTVGHCHGVLSQALRWGVRMGVVRNNMADAVDAPRAQRYEARVLSWDEVSILLSAAESTGSYPIILIALLTGLRRSELLGLRWRDIDLDNAFISVNHGLVRLPKRLVLGPTKSGRPRSVSLPVQVVECLAGVLESRRDDGMAGPDDMVFCRSDGSPLRPDGVTRAFIRLASEVGILGVRFHDLRHTHASLLLGEGVHLKVVSERLGHSGIAITADLYSHVSLGLQQEAAVQLGDRFNRL